MAMHIRGIFKDEGMILSLGSKHGLPVMAALCSQHKIAAESLCDKWRVFAEMQDMDDGAQADMVLLQKFADTVKKQFRPTKKQKKGGGMIASSNLIQKQKPAMVVNDLSILAGFGVTTVDKGVKSPTQAGIQSPSGLSDFASSPDRDASLASPTQGSSVASSLSLQRQNLSGAPSECDRSFVGRADKRKVEHAFPSRDGPHAAAPLSSMQASSGAELSGFEELGSATEKSDRYMHDKLKDQATALQRRCLQFGAEILAKHGMSVTNHNDPLELSQEATTVVGRVCKEMVAPKFTAQAAFLEVVWEADSGTLAERAKLDLAQVRGHIIGHLDNPTCAHSLCRRISVVHAFHPHLDAGAGLLALPGPDYCCRGDCDADARLRGRREGHQGLPHRGGSASAPY